MNTSPAKSYSSYTKELKICQPYLRCLDPYKGSRVSHKFKCLKCKSKFDMIASTAIHRYKDKTACKYCRSKERGYSKRPSITNDEFIKTFVKNKQHLQFELMETYKSARCQIKVKCLKCKEISSIEASEVKNKNKGCPKCNRRVPHYLTGDVIIDRFKHILPHIIFKETPKAMYKPCKLYCKICKTTYISKPQNLVDAKFGCDICAKLNTGYKRKLIKFKGKTYLLQGYEPKALPLIYKKYGSIIKTNKEVPRFIYGENRRYYPDFYIPGTKTIIEVKSNYTFGGREAWFTNLLEKRKAVKNNGFKFKLLVFGPKDQIILPKKWYDLSFGQIRPLLGLHGSDRNSN